MTAVLHVVGAGLAGLAAGVAAARAGHRVVVYEAAGHAGGRCRSFRDERLERVIDNGSHLVLGANRTALAYARATGGLAAMVPSRPRFPFVDLDSGRTWTVSPTSMPVGLGEALRAMGLPWVGANETVADRLGTSRSFTRFWRPMCEAIMNTAPEEASARMFGWTMRRALLGGGKALVPWTFPHGLSAALVAPALATLAASGARVHFRRRLSAVSPQRLTFDTGDVVLGPRDKIILALPPWAVSTLIPGLGESMPTRPIVNAHFVLGQPVRLPGDGHFLGLVNAQGHWLFARDDVLSVTVSAAGPLAEADNEQIAALLWNEAARAIGRPQAALPPWRIMKERRATLAHDHGTIAKRPGHETPLDNVLIAGDWLASPWPCTIEAAISSGLAAARLAVGQADLAF